jgi:predicted dehydrogenase
MSQQGRTIGVVGCGHWGPNYVRNFREMEGVSAVVCCDTQAARLERLTRRLPDVHTCTDYRDLIRTWNVDAVVVATPASTHYPIIKEFLSSGKDVLAEKPLTVRPDEAQELSELADRLGRVLMVGHIFLYNEGVRKLKELIDGGKLGRIYYLNATRTHLGLLRDDVNVVWDLAPHDVSIFNYLLGSGPVSVSAMGASHLKPGREDVAFINLLYPNNVVANIHVSWEDSNKERTIRVVGSEARVVFDDIEVLERVKVYYKGISVPEADSFGEFQLRLRDGDIVSPKVEFGEPLRTMCQHFLQCVTSRARPVTDGRGGYEVVRVMTAIESALRSGQTVALDKR